MVSPGAVLVVRADGADIEGRVPHLPDRGGVLAGEHRHGRTACRHPACSKSGRLLKVRRDRRGSKGRGGEAVDKDWLH